MYDAKGWVTKKYVSTLLLCSSSAYVNVGKYDKDRGEHADKDKL